MDGTQGAVCNSHVKVAADVVSIIHDLCCSSVATYFHQALTISIAYHGDEGSYTSLCRVCTVLTD